MSCACTIVLSGDRSAVAVLVPSTVSGEEALAALGLATKPPGVVVLNGGTAELSTELDATLRGTLGALAEIVVEEGLTVVTGGTDAGIFAVFGRALGDDRSAPCIGVVPEARVTWPDRTRVNGTPAGDEPVPLEPHHSHFLLVEGSEWGVETDAMLALTAALSADRPSLAVLAGGGPVADREVRGHLLAGREVLVLAETGRLADQLTGELVGQSRMTAETASRGLVTVIGAGTSPSTLAGVVRERLHTGRGG